MKRQNSFLLISPNSDLHRTLELVAATYNSRLLSAESAKKGIGLIAAGQPDCVIFDLAILPNPKHKQVIKQKIEKIGVPTMWLNDSSNGVIHTCSKLEPLVKFILDHCDPAKGSCSGGLFGRFLSFFSLRRT